MVVKLNSEQLDWRAFGFRNHIHDKTVLLTIIYEQVLGFRLVAGSLIMMQIWRMNII